MRTETRKIPLLFSNIKCNLLFTKSIIHVSVQNCTKSTLQFSSRKYKYANLNKSIARKGIYVYNRFQSYLCIMYNNICWNILNYIYIYCLLYIFHVSYMEKKASFQKSTRHQKLQINPKSKKRFSKYKFTKVSFFVDIFRSIKTLGLPLLSVIVWTQDRRRWGYCKCYVNFFRRAVLLAPQWYH